MTANRHPGNPSSGQTIPAHNLKVLKQQVRVNGNQDARAIPSKEPCDPAHGLPLFSGLPHRGNDAGRCIKDKYAIC